MQLPSSDPCLLAQECVTDVSRVVFVDIFNNLKKLFFVTFLVPVHKFKGNTRRCDMFLFYIFF